MIAISHKIEIVPNNAAKTHFRKAFGCSRLAYNWGLSEWQRRYKSGEKTSALELKKSFNAIKKEQYPFVYEVTKYATQQPFLHLGKAFDKFFADLKKGIVSYPQFKKKRDSEGSFYIGGDQVKLSDVNLNSPRFKYIEHNKSGKHHYLKIPNLGWVKMSERLRFNGKINGVSISQQGTRFFASFSLMITEAEYERTHKKSSTREAESAVGIDLGIKTAVTLSSGIGISSPNALKNGQRKIKRISRQLSKRVHAKTKQERLSGVAKSNNYKKLALQLNKTHGHICNIRKDFTHKATTLLVTHYSTICMEDLNTKAMMRNHKLANALSDVSFGEFTRMIDYKSSYNRVKLHKVGRFYPSSKMCSCCGSVKNELELKDRTYHCDKCGAVIDRDYNASLNLLYALGNKQIGTVQPEFTPVDLSALLADCASNRLTTSKVETGKQQELYDFE